jgi:hypothetical protein
MHNSPSQNRDEKHSHSTQAKIRFTPRDSYGSEERTWPDEGRAWGPPLSVDRSYRRLEENDRKRVDVLRVVEGLESSLICWKSDGSKSRK